RADRMKEEQEIPGRDDHHPTQRQQRLMLPFNAVAKRCAAGRRLHRGLRTNRSKGCTAHSSRGLSAKPRIFCVVASRRHTFGAISVAFSTTGLPARERLSRRNRLTSSAEIASYALSAAPFKSLGP